MNLKIHSKLLRWWNFQHEASFHASEQMRITYTNHNIVENKQHHDFLSSEKHNNASTTSASCSARLSCWSRYCCCLNSKSLILLLYWSTCSRSIASSTWKGEINHTIFFQATYFFIQYFSHETILHSLIKLNLLWTFIFFSEFKF